MARITLVKTSNINCGKECCSFIPIFSPANFVLSSYILAVAIV